MILMGGDVLSRKDGDGVYNLVKKIANDNGVVDATKGWNGLNVLQPHSSTVGALDLGIVPRKSATKPKVVFLVGADNNLSEKDFDDDQLVVYVGCIGDQGIYYSDVILPGMSYLEKEGTFVNTEGRVQITRKATGAPGESRNDWEYFRILSELMGVTLPYEDIE